MKEITARLWDNPKFGTTYGKGQYRRAIYNGTLEVIEPRTKYLVDFEEIEAWFNFAKAEVHRAMTKRLDELPVNETGVLMSWIYRYELANKIPVQGYAALDLNHHRLIIEIEDGDTQIHESWNLPVRACIARTPGKPTPALIATNATLLDSPQNPATNGVFVGANTRALEELAHRMQR
jgi:hypothetical protein